MNEPFFTKLKRAWMNTYVDSHLPYKTVKHAFEAYCLVHKIWVHLGAWNIFALSNEQLRDLAHIYEQYRHLEKKELIDHLINKIESW